MYWASLYAHAERMPGGFQFLGATMFDIVVYADVVAV